MHIVNEVTRLFAITYHIIQAGMVWTAGWRLAAAVADCGGLGLIGSGSMKPELLRSFWAESVSAPASLRATSLKGKWKQARDRGWCMKSFL